MKKQYFYTSLLTAILLFVLNAIVFKVFLGKFFLDHPAVSPEFMRQLYLPDNELIWWAVIISAIAIGFLVTLVIQWSGARSFSSGLRHAFSFALLLLLTVDMGLLGTTNNFTVAGAFADLCCSTITLTIGGAFAAWMLGRNS